MKPSYSSTPPSGTTNVKFFWAQLLGIAAQCVQISACHVEQAWQTATINTDISSHTNYWYLSPSEKEKRLCELHNAIISSKKLLQQLKDRLAKSIDDIGVKVDQQMNDDLIYIMKNNEKLVKLEFPPHSFPHLCWEQQMKAGSAKDARAKRWHPLIIKWCMYLQHKSSGAYELLRDSGSLNLREDACKP